MTLLGWRGALVAGGDFTTAGGTAVAGLAQWDGDVWTSIGGGTDAAVTSLAVYEGDLVVGGAFSQAGGQPFGYIARWDGEAWHALDSGMNGPVSALAVFGGDLIAGGFFTMAGGAPAPYIARWDGAHWSSLGEFEGRVEGLDVYRDELIAVGLFDDVDGSPVGHAAAWNGIEWTDLAGGLDGRARAVAVHDGRLVVGGLFSRAGDVEASNVAAWDGQNWSPLGSGTDDEVLALGIYHEALAAGGAFARAGGQLAPAIAQWDGTEWTALGSGTDGAVRSVMQHNGHLYVGGTFANAGTKPSSRIAQWDGGPNEGEEYVVRTDGTGDFRTIQAAVEAAATENDVIRVDPGSYGEDVTVVQKDVGIFSTAPVPVASRRDSSRARGAPVVDSFSWVGSDLDAPGGGTLDGFAVLREVQAQCTSGFSARNCLVSGPMSMSLLLADGAIVVSDCAARSIDVVVGESGEHDSGVHGCITNDGVSISAWNASVSGCVVQGEINASAIAKAVVEDCEVYSGIRADAFTRSSTVKDCLVHGGDIAVSGGYYQADTSEIIGNRVLAGGITSTAPMCVIADNICSNGTVGIAAESRTFAEISRNVIAGAGTGIRIDSGGATAGNTVVGCTNIGIHYEERLLAPDVHHNLVVDNGVGFRVDFETAADGIACNDVWANGQDWLGVPDQAGLNGNFAADPLFCDRDHGVLSVRSDSPCAADNNPACGRIGALGVDCTPPGLGACCYENGTCEYLGATECGMTGGLYRGEGSLCDPNPCGPAGTPDHENLPHNLVLAQPVPSPSSGMVRFRFSSPVDQMVRLEIFNVRGELVSSPSDGMRAKGFHEIEWDGTGLGGAAVASGIYFVRLSTGAEEIVRRIVLLR